ncbi:MAG: 50S ribosomal protein L17 [Bradymonadaceae bacterium]|nr:50S ribosomal protein L17 [Lujinxingiaceae bacterium]
MRHLKSGRSLSRDAAHRKAMLQNLAASLIKYEIIQTTDAKAKELRRVTDRLITLGKRGTLHARRQALAQINDAELIGKLFDDLAKREAIATREGGYTRLIKVGNRQGDNAPISRISWVGSTLENTEALRYPAHIREQFVTEDEDETEA